MYVGLFVYFLHEAVSKNRWISFLVGIVCVAAAAWGATQIFPSLAMKYSYTRFDQSQYFGGTGGSYSDSGRMASLVAGWEIVKEHPLLGVGTGDLPSVTNQKTLIKHPEFIGNVKLPHNQWLFIWASTGLLGLLSSLLALLFWTLKKIYYGNTLFVGFQAIALVSLLVEYTFETSIGAAFFLFNYCILVHASISTEMRIE
jgi:O-antigen ligase